MRKKPKVNLKWTFHNIVAHPLSEMMHLAACLTNFAKLEKLSDRLEQTSDIIHDVTVPKKKDD